MQNSKIANKIQFGVYAEDQTSLMPNSHVDVQIAFEQAFASVPTVTISLSVNTTGYADYGNISLSVLKKSLSKSGFTVRMMAGNTGAVRMPGFTWIAVC